MMEETDVKLGKCLKGHDNAYSHPYDAYYCPTCDVWLESGCFDFDCYYCCPHRPEKPSQVDYTKVTIAKQS